MDWNRLNPRTWFTGRKTLSSAEILRYIWGGSLGSSTTPQYKPLAQSGYQGNADVYACIREIATAARGIPIRAYRETGAGEREPLDDGHPLQSILRMPNPRMSGSAFVEWLVSYHLLAGNAFILKGAPEGLRIARELYLLRPDTVKAIAGDTMGSVARYEYRPGAGRQVDYEPDMVCDFPFFNPLDELAGQPPMQAAVTGIDIGNRGRSWNYNLLGNSARPSGLLSTDQGLTQDQRDALQQAIDANFAGADNAGKIPVLEAGLTWQQTSMSPGEMEWGGMLTMSTRDICKVFNVPPELVGDSQNKTYSNYQEARQALYMETVLPLMDWICDELTGWLAPQYGTGISIGYDASGIEALAEDTDKLWARLAGAWYLTPNQRLQAMGFEASTDPLMDKVYVPAGFLPIEAVAGDIGLNGDDEIPKE